MELDSRAVVAAILDSAGSRRFRASIQGTFMYLA
jgi:hypothetical protein